MLSLALASFERTTYFLSFIYAAITAEKATIAEKGVCPFKNPSEFRRSIFLSRVLVARTISLSLNPAVYAC